MQHTRWSSGLMLAVLLGIVAGAGFSQGIGALAAQTQPQTPKDLVSYRDIVKKVLPAVVSVKVVGRPQLVRGSGRGEAQNDAEDEMRQFFEQMQRRNRQPVPSPGQFGSGVIVDPKGVIVTNNHVVAGATEVEVSLSDGRKFLSRAIFTDPKTDLAVVKVETKGSLPYVSFGDSDAMEIGDRVLAVGAPFGLSGTVTQGIISGKSRHIGLNMYEDFLQTDAAINPGNSGGPLVSLDGKVIGINAAIKSENGGFMGVGLAIPSKVAKDVVEQLASKGAVRRGYLGVKVGELTPEVAKQLKLNTEHGVVVGEVYADSPAKKAGLQEGDVVLRIDGKEVTDPKVLQQTVTFAPIGKVLAFDIVREGQPQTVKVTIEQQPDTYGLEERAPRVSPRRQPRPDTVSLEKLGIEVADLTPALAEQLGYARSAKGALIVQVEPGSLAQSVGLRRGMLIAQADKKAVTSAEGLKSQVAKASLQEGLLLLVRTPQGGSQYVVIQEQ
jgi:serine protease Do